MQNIPDLAEPTSHAPSDEASTMVFFAAKQVTAPIADLDDGTTQASLQGSASLMIFAAAK